VCTSLDLLAILHGQVSAGWNGVAGQHLVRLRIGDDDLRVQVFLVLNDDDFLVAGGFVGFLGEGDARDHVAELDLTGFLSDDRDVIGIPGDELLTLLHLAAIRLR
jgi:hypothetical protein